MKTNLPDPSPLFSHTSRNFAILISLWPQAIQDLDSRTLYQKLVFTLMILTPLLSKTEYEP